MTVVILCLVLDHKGEYTAHLLYLSFNMGCIYISHMNGVGPSLGYLMPVSLVFSFGKWRKIKMNLLLGWL